MKRRFTSTLMASVVALLAIPAITFGAAPVIGDLPDFVVGDAEYATDFFIFEDAIDLRNFVSDEDSTPSQLAWSYVTPGGLGTGSQRYMINGVAELDLDGSAPDDDPAAPGSKSIQDQVLQDEFDLDSNAQTITIRDIIQSPMSGVGDSAPASIESQTVTFFVTDETTESASTSVMMYTEDEAYDRFASDPVGERVETLNFIQDGPGDWDSETVSGDVTFSEDGGICLEVPDEGENMGEWFSEDEQIELVQNSVWRIRVQVTSDQTTPGSVPLWNMFIDNYDDDIGGPFGYGGDMFILDNAGSANAAGPIGRTDFQYWYTPSAIQSPKWTGEADDEDTSVVNPFDWTVTDDYDDMRLHFRVLDLDSNGINSEADSGVLCMSKLSIDRFDLDDLEVEEEVWEVDAHSATSTTVDIASGNATYGFDEEVQIDPLNPIIGYGDEVVTITPGTYEDADFGTGENLDENYVVPWESDVLYRFMAELQNLDDGNYPSDLHRLGMDCPGNELISYSLATPGLGNPAYSYLDTDSSEMVDVPKRLPPSSLYVELLVPGLSEGMDPTVSSTPVNYQMFLYSHSASEDSRDNFDRLRPIVDSLNTTSVVLGGVTDARDSWNLDNMSVDIVSFPTTP